MKIRDNGLVKLEKKDRVRIVQMNGCMAHVPENPREGLVTGFEVQEGPGFDSVPWREARYVVIKLDDGDIIKKPSVPRLWTMRDGLPEYEE